MCVAPWSDEEAWSDEEGRRERVKTGKPFSVVGDDKGGTPAKPAATGGG